MTITRNCVSRPPFLCLQCAHQLSSSCLAENRKNEDVTEYVPITFTRAHVCLNIIANSNLHYYKIYIGIITYFGKDFWSSLVHPSLKAGQNSEQDKVSKGHTLRKSIPIRNPVSGCIQTTMDKFQICRCIPSPSRFSTSLPCS